MIGYRFTEFFLEKTAGQNAFDNLFNIFFQLLFITSVDVNESLNWLTKLDQKHGISTVDYSIDDFIDDLKKERVCR